MEKHEIWELLIISISSVGPANSKKVGIKQIYQNLTSDEFQWPQHIKQIQLSIQDVARGLTSNTECIDMFEFVDADEKDIYFRLKDSKDKLLKKLRNSNNKVVEQPWITAYKSNKLLDQKNAQMKIHNFNENKNKNLIY